MPPQRGPRPVATEAPTTRHYRIRGRVQGVGFRHFVWREANDRKIAGWVRNRRDGSVEVLAHAEVAELDAFEQPLARGPRWGRVDVFERVDDLEQIDELPTDFEIRPTV